MTTPGKQNETSAVSDSVESTRQEELIPIPEALYSCHICREDCSWPADSLFWSPKLETWICSECYDESEHGDRGPRLVDEIKRRAPCVGGAQQTSGEKEPATAATREGQDELLAIVSAVAEDNCIYGHEKCNSSDCFPCRAKRLLSEHGTKSENGSEFSQTPTPSVESGTENQPTDQVSPKSVNERTCLHHTDAERAAAWEFNNARGCPVCAKAQAPSSPAPSSDSGSVSSHDFVNSMRGMLSNLRAYDKQFYDDHGCARLSAVLQSSNPADSGSGSTKQEEGK